MAQVENKPGVPTQDLSFLNKMKTVKEELEKLDLQDPNLTKEDCVRQIRGALEKARRTYLDKGWIDNSRKLEPVLSSLTNGEITPEAILQAISDNKEKEKPAKKGWKSLFKRG